MENKDCECDCLNHECQIDSILNTEAQIDNAIEGYVEVSKTYTGLETDDIIVNVDNKNYEISATLKKIRYDTFADFPETGSANLLYVDTSENAVYYWDAEKTSYVLLVDDWRKIKIINGGKA